MRNQDPLGEAGIAGLRETSLRPSNVIAFPGRVCASPPSLTTRLLNAFALAAVCLYPEFLCPLLALNQAVMSRFRPPMDVPPENEAA